MRDSALQSVRRDAGFSAEMRVSALEFRYELKQKRPNVFTEKQTYSQCQ